MRNSFTKTSPISSATEQLLFLYQKNGKIVGVVNNGSNTGIRLYVFCLVFRRMAW